MRKILRDRKLEIEKAKRELEFEKSLEIRNFEIDKFWLRGWFFGALIIAIIAGYFELFKEPEQKRYCIYVSFLALIISAAQSLMNRGSKYWQERWEYHTKNKESNLDVDITKMEKIFISRSDNFVNKLYKEKDLIEAYILAKDENLLTKCRRFSVSKLTILVWDIITLFCLGLWLRDTNIVHLFKSSQRYEPRYYTITFHIIIAVYIILFFRKGNVYEKLGKNLILKSEKNKQNPETISREDLQKTYLAGNLKEL